MKRIITVAVVLGIAGCSGNIAGTDATGSGAGGVVGRAFVSDVDQRSGLTRQVLDEVWDRVVTEIRAQAPTLGLTAQDDFSVLKTVEGVDGLHHVRLQQTHGGVKVFGGVVLNHGVGGLNAQAVEWMWRLQGGHGRVVWFPTFDNDNHVRQRGTAPSGIRVVDDRGVASPEARAILKICARQRLVVHTGHSSAEQALALIAAAREEGCDRVVVTHCQFEVVGMDEAQMKKAAALGAKMELCALGMLVGPESHLEWMRESVRVPLKDTAAKIRSVGAQHFVLGTDLGQSGNPTPVDGLTLFVTGLLAEGVTAAQIQTMGREVPGALLMG